VCAGAYRVGEETGQQLFWVSGVRDWRGLETRCRGGRGGLGHNACLLFSCPASGVDQVNVTWLPALRLSPFLCD
jgi:hypothetical protein